MLLLNLKHKRVNHSRKAGFTMIELMFVLMIVAILGYFAKGRYDNIVKNAAVRSTTASLDSLKTVITGYHLKTNQYPRRLEDLIIKPADMTQAQWGEPYLEKEAVPVDGWGNEFYYKLNPKGHVPPYVLYSWGPHGEGSPDDEHIFA